VSHGARRRQSGYAAVALVATLIAVWSVITRGSAIVAVVMMATALAAAVAAARDPRTPWLKTEHPPRRRASLLGRVLLLAMSPWLPYRAALALVASFLVLRYVIAPGSPLGTDMALSLLSLPVFVGLAFLARGQPR